MSACSDQILAALGQDFGSVSSKITLAYRNGDTTKVLRVAANVPLDHPERIRTPYASTFLGEFCSFAGLDIPNRRLVPGRAAFAQAQTFPLKTIFAHRIGLANNGTLQRLPGGMDLLQACRDGQITTEMEDEALRCHFSFLRDQALDRASAAGVTVRTIVLTYPSYLYEANNDDVDRYTSFYIHLIRPLWAAYGEAKGLRLQFETMSEGQSIAIYICEPWDDVAATFNRTRMWTSLGELNKQAGINIAFSDNGSSTLNFQVQSVYYDRDGIFLNSQSNVGAGWQSGAVGGSHSANEAIRELIRKDLTSGWSLHEIAQFIKVFEEKKLSLDPDRMPLQPDGSEMPLELIGLDRRKTVVLMPAHLQHAFNTAFKPSLDVIKTEIRRMVLLGKDFIIVFCGGSYLNPWLRRVVSEYAEKAQVRASRQKPPVNVRYLFLPEFDSSWPSAVSSGASIAALRLPEPVQSLNTSAIALQKINLDESGDWVPSCNGQILLSKGCMELPRYVYTVPVEQRLRFRLVCDPNDYKKPEVARISRSKDSTARLRPLFIDRPERVLNGPFSTYDLGFEVDSTNLPPGVIVFHLASRAARRIATSHRVYHPRDFAAQYGITPHPSSPETVSPEPEEPTSLLNTKPVLRILLCCYQVDNKGHRLKHNLDKRWELGLSTDLASKLLIVDQVKELPVWCRNCSELIRLAYTCPSCPRYSVCDGCFDNDPDQSPHENHGVFLKTLIEIE